MLKSFENKLFLLCTAFVLTFNGLFYAFAEESTEDETVVTVTDGVDYSCGYQTMVDAQGIVDSYQTFLDDYFKIVTPSSDQVEDAMKYYRFVKKSIQAVYERNLKVGSNDTLEESTQATTYCAFIRDQYLDLAQALLQKQVISSSNSKRTFVMIDGLKSINTDLESFSNEFNAVFPGFFNQFNNALPCYARQCIVK